MTDKIKKFLSKLSAKDLQVIRGLIARIIANDLKGLNVTRLKGSTNIFRVKKGKLRIIYTLDKAGGAKILSIARRSEKTYKDF